MAGVTGVVTVEDTVLDGLRERVKELALELGELRQEYYQSVGVEGDEA